MDTKGLEIFSTVQNAVEHFGQQWKVVCSEVHDALTKDNIDHKRLKELNNFDIDTQQACKDFSTSLDSPLLSIAATGTTSSGKSTLLNFIAGVELLPCGVQEVSAGSVIVMNSDRSNIKIQDWTRDGVQVEEIDDLGAKAIYVRLEHDMKRHYDVIKNTTTKTEFSAVNPPSFEIMYPLNGFVFEKLRKHLPKNAQLQLIDLPGVNYCGDERHKALISDAVGKSLTLILFDCSATDPNTRAESLRQIVDKVKDIGGSISQMLFVMTKVDVFYKHEDANAMKDAHFSKMEQEIREKLKEALPEQEPAIDAAKFCKISQHPAFLAILAGKFFKQKDESDQYCKAVKCIQKFYGYLMNDDFYFPPKPIKYNAAQHRELVSSVLENSFANEFADYLVAHVGANLPAIVLPSLYNEKFKRGAAVNWVLQMCEGQIHAATSDIESVINMFNADKKIIQQVIREEQERLEAFCHSFAGPERDSDAVRDYFRGIDRFSSMLIPKDFSPISQFPETIKNAFMAVVEAAWKNLRTGVLANEISRLQGVSPDNSKWLENACKTLRSNGFSDAVLENGVVSYAPKDDADKDRMVAMAAGMRMFQESFGNVLAQHLDAVTQREEKRIRTLALQIVEDACARMKMRLSATSKACQYIKLKEINLEEVCTTFQASYPYPRHTSDFVKHVQKNVKTEKKVDVPVERSIFNPRRIFGKYYIETKHVQVVVVQNEYTISGIRAMTDEYKRCSEELAQSRKKEFIKFVELCLRNAVCGLQKYATTQCDELLEIIQEAQEQEVANVKEKLERWDAILGKARELDLTMDRVRDLCISHRAVSR